MPGPFDVGQTITLEVALSDPDTHDAVTAGDLVCHVQPPGGGSVENVTPVTLFDPGGADEPAVYRARYVIAVVGEHWYQFSSVTLGGVLKEGAFVANKSRVA